MGDDRNVATRRSEDSSPSSSPILGPRIKDLDECRIREISEEEKESLLPSRPESGEPGEGIQKIVDDKHVVVRDLPEGAADALESPLLLAPRGRPVPTAAAFPFSETKLRPDAPPFTPESLTRNGPAATRDVEGLDDSDCGEPSFVPRSEIDDSCFVNVDLRSATDDSVLPPKPKQRTVANAHTGGPKAGIRDSRDPVKEPGLKPFSLTSTPRLKRSPPKIDLSVDSVQADVETSETVAVATEAGANDPDIRETGPESGEPRIVRGRWRIFRSAFVVGNRIQIAVFIASIVLCVVIIVYVFL